MCVHISVLVARLRTLSLFSFLEACLCFSVSLVLLTCAFSLALHRPSLRTIMTLTFSPIFSQVIYSGTLSGDEAANQVRKDREDASLWVEQNIDRSSRSRAIQRECLVHAENARLQDDVKMLKEKVAAMEEAMASMVIAGAASARETFMLELPDQAGAGASGGVAVFEGNSAVRMQPLISRNLYYKRAMCRFWASGNCTMGQDCRFAHSSDELQRFAPARSVGQGYRNEQEEEEEMDQGLWPPQEP